VTQAPILTSVITSEEEEWRLDVVLLRVGPLNRFIQKMANQVNFFVNSYHAVMSNDGNVRKDGASGQTDETFERDGMQHQVRIVY
jgi:hypothetical protein